MTDRGAGVEDDLVRAVVVQVFGDVGVDDLTRLTGGASRHTWRCAIGGEVFIVQRQRADVERDVALEAAVLRAARREGVPAPEAVAYSPGVDGHDSLVTRHVPGETIARKILRDEAYEGARRVLTGQLGTALARIHRIDPAAVAGLAVVDPLLRYRILLDELAAPHPTFELALRWLDDHRPPAGRQTVVHGDFRLGNVIVDTSGLAAVIDWELAHLGDPMEDLGWMCIPAWRFGSPLAAAGVGTREELYTAYAAEAGVDVDPDVARWWEICGILRWGVLCIVQAEAHRSGLTRSHELAAIGRRVCENEHDLFLALEGRW